MWHNYVYFWVKLRNLIYGDVYDTGNTMYYARSLKLEIFPAWKNNLNSFHTERVEVKRRVYHLNKR